MLPSEIYTYQAMGRRSIQEDGLWCNSTRGIFAVADGFGSQGTEKTAAQVALDRVREFLEREAGDLDATLPFVMRSYYSLTSNVLYNALLYSNRMVWNANLKVKIADRVGASVCAAYVDGGLFSIAQIGNCSSWLFRERQWRELSVPRSISRLMDPVILDAQEGRDIPLGAIGIGADLEPEVFEYKVQSGDWIVLQTDGVTTDMRESFQAVFRQTDRTDLDFQKSVSLVAHGDNASALILGF